MAQTEAFLAYDHSIAESAFSCLPCTALHQLWHERVLNQALHDGWLECVYVFLCVCLSVCVCVLGSTPAPRPVSRSCLWSQPDQYFSVMLGVVMC